MYVFSYGAASAVYINRVNVTNTTIVNNITVTNVNTTNIRYVNRGARSGDCSPTKCVRQRAIRAGCRGAGSRRGSAIGTSHEHGASGAPTHQRGRKRELIAAWL